MSMFRRSRCNEPHTIRDLKPHVGQAWPLAAGVPHLAGPALSKLLAALCDDEVNSGRDGCRSEDISQSPHSNVRTVECSERSSAACPGGNRHRHGSGHARSPLSRKEPRQ
jgi:hypothetical protein